MNWEALVAIIVPVTFMLTVGGVILLRPISKRLGDLIDVYAKERHEGLQVEVQQLRDQLETTQARLELLEDRQDFTERLLSSGEQAAKVPAEKRAQIPRSVG